MREGYETLSIYPTEDRRFPILKTDDQAIAQGNNFLLANQSQRALNRPMSGEESHPFTRRESRRQFVKQAGVITAAMAGAPFLELPLLAASRSESVSLVLASDELAKEAPVQWAAGQLRDSLKARGVNVQSFETLEQAPQKQQCILIAGKNRASTLAGPLVPEVPEALVLTRLSGKRPIVLVCGSDARGMVYALLDLADRLSFSGDPLGELRSIKTTVERPANRIRSVGRLFSSDVEDKPWFNNRDFWQRYLTMLATNRFNRINLTFGLAYDFTRDITDCYFHFAYPFLLSVPGYNVRAVPLPDAERDANLKMLRFISDEAARRGLEFQVGIWTHAYHWTNSPRANYTIEGLTPESLGPYSRDALRLLLAECPNITGVTIRTHGESGVAEGNTEIWSTIFSGVAGCGRKVEIDLHAKGITTGIIDAALATGMPVNISPKFWAEHMGLPYMQGAIRQQEMPPPNANDRGFFSRSSGARSFLRYGYGDLLAEDRRYGVLHRIWPGTQRVLLWGDPETAAAYGRVASFCGSNGVELYEPLSFKGRKGSGLPGGRDAYADASLKPQFDFEKYEYTYRVWGRNLFNPDTDPDGWQRLLRDQFPQSSDHAESTLSAAGKILPLITTAHCPSAANNLYWPEMYWNMQMTDANHRQPYSDTPSPKRFGTVSPLDPEFFLSCDDYAEELLKGEQSGKYSPAWVADQLEDHAEKTTSALRKLKVRDARNVDFRRLKIDATIQAGVGTFFAAKFRSGVFFGIYLRTHDRQALQEALRENQFARATWAQLANVAKGIYREDVSYGPDYYQRGHWLDRLPAMDEDIADMEKLLASASEGSAAASDRARVKSAIQIVRKRNHHNEHIPLSGLHTPPASFKRAEKVSIVAIIAPVSNHAMIKGLRLRYRRVNQAEVWQVVDMTRSGAEYRATIPGDYSDSPFPLQYHFQICEVSGRAWLYPGFERMWNGQPYYVLRQS